MVCIHHKESFLTWVGTSKCSVKVTLRHFFAFSLFFLLLARFNSQQVSVDFPLTSCVTVYRLFVTYPSSLIEAKVFFVAGGQMKITMF